MPKFQVIGTGKFNHIKGKSGETTAKTESEAIRNIAFRNGIRDDYFYFKSTVKIEILPETLKTNPNQGLKRWIERQ